MSQYYSSSGTLVLCPPGSAPNKGLYTAFMTDVKKALGPEKSSQLFKAIHAYKQNDNYEKMVTTVVSLFTERQDDFDLLMSK